MPEKDSSRGEQLAEKGGVAPSARFIKGDQRRSVPHETKRTQQVSSPVKNVSHQEAAIFALVCGVRAYRRGFVRALVLLVKLLCCPVGEFNSCHLMSLAGQPVYIQGLSSQGDENL